LKFTHHTTLKSYRAICCIGEKLLLCKANKLYLYDIPTDSKEWLLTIPFKKKYQYFSFFKKFRRLFRLDISYAYYSEKLSILFVCAAGTIYEIDLDRREIICTFDLPRGSRPLNLTEINGIKGFEDGLYFGEYFGNPNFTPVHIYRRTGSGNWEIVYTFPADTIYHIHNLIPDPYRNCLWIFCGDMDQHAGIWKAESNFENVEVILEGSQQYRACFGLVTEDRLIYATDSQMIENTVCEVVFDGEKYDFRKLHAVEGSVIYGSRFNGQFLGATAVEPGGINTPVTVHKIFNTKRGPGIKSNNSTIFLYDYNKGIYQEFKRNKKDPLPFFLFEFGSMIFPTGMEHSQYLVWYNVALKENDCGTQIYKITNNE